MKIYDRNFPTYYHSRIASRICFPSALLFLGAVLCSPQVSFAEQQVPVAQENAANMAPDTVNPPLRQSHEAVEPSQEASAAGENERDYSRQYIGAFVEYSARAGASIATDAPYSGWNIDIGMRHSFPVLLGDFRVAYRYDHLSPTDSAGAALREQNALLEQHSVGGYLAIHPGYLLLLGSDQLSYTLASLHLELGFGAQYSVLEPTQSVLDAGGDYKSNFAPFLSVGVGLGIPILDPDVGYAPWLHLVYRWHVADFDGDIETFDLDMHLLQVGLGWRINGLLF